MKLGCWTTKHARNPLHEAGLYSTCFRRIANYLKIGSGLMRGMIQAQYGSSSVRMMRVSKEPQVQAGMVSSPRVSVP